MVILEDVAPSSCGIGEGGDKVELSTKAEAMAADAISRLAGRQEAVWVVGPVGSAGAAGVAGAAGAAEATGAGLATRARAPREP